METEMENAASELKDTVSEYGYTASGITYLIEQGKYLAQVSKGADYFSCKGQTVCEAIAAVGDRLHKEANPDKKALIAELQRQIAKLEA